MIKYLLKLLTGFSEHDNLKKGVKTPAHGKLFEIRDKKEAEYLSDKQAQEFHHVKTKLLFMCNCAH